MEKNIEILTFFKDSSALFAESLCPIVKQSYSLYKFESLLSNSKTSSIRSRVTKSGVERILTLSLTRHPGTYAVGFTNTRVYGEKFDDTILNARSDLRFRQTTIRLSARSLFLAPFYKNPWVQMWCMAFMPMKEFGSSQLRSQDTGNISARITLLRTRGRRSCLEFGQSDYVRDMKHLTESGSRKRYDGPRLKHGQQYNADLKAAYSCY